jgi:PREDICTED: hypothetical protein, partial|nr:MAG TPA: Huntingtin protein-like protein [Caudoviricetes sp.]
MFFRRERDMIVPGLVGGAVGALAAGYIVSRDGRKIPVDKNGNPVQGQAQGQAQAQGGEHQAANQNQNQQQQAPANQQGQQQQAQAGGQQGGADSGGNAKAEKPQAQATTQQPAATQNNTTTQKSPVQNTPTPAQAPATPPPAQTQTPPPAQNTQPKPTTTTQPSGNTATTTSQTTTPPKPNTTTTSTGGNTTQTTQKPANNTTKTQPTAPKTTTQSTPTTQNKNTQGQFKRPENFDRNAARQQKWQANRDRKDAGIARRNSLQKQQAAPTATTQPKPAGNTGGFIRNTAGDTDTRRLNAMYRGPIVKQKAPQQAGKISSNGLRYTPNGATTAAQTVTNNATQTAANAAKQTGQHIRDRRAADPLKDRIVRARANIQKDLRKERLRTEAYKTNATSTLGRAGDRTSTFFKRRGQDIKTGVKTVGSGIKTGASAVGSGFKRAAGTFRKGGAVNGFVRNTGKAIRNMPARAGSAYLGGVSRVLGGMSRGLGRASARSRVASGFLKSAIKK